MSEVLGVSNSPDPDDHPLTRESFDTREDWLRHRKASGDWPADKDDPDFIGMMSLGPRERSDDGAEPVE